MFIICAFGSIMNNTFNYIPSKNIFDVIIVVEIYVYCLLKTKFFEWFSLLKVMKTD